MILPKLAYVAALTLTAPASAAISGLYGTPCLALEGLSLVKDIYLEAGEFQIVQTIFTDSECRIPAYDFAFTGTYELDADLGTLDMHFAAIELTPLEARVAEAFTEQQLCGLAEWTSEQTVAVNNRTCGHQAIPAAGSTVYETIRETEDGIQLGVLDEHMTGDTPALRPTQFETVTYLAR